MREDWTECTLGEICEKTRKVKRKEMPLSKNIKYLDIGAIDNVSNKIVSHKEYSWQDAPSRAQQIIKKGDVLFSTVRTYLKNIAIVKSEEYENEICSSGFTVLRRRKSIIASGYIFYFSLSTSFLNSLNKLQTGTSYPAVRAKDVFAQNIPLPPLPTQRAIVSKIESLFTLLDSSITDLKRAQAQLKIYRQAVLKKAFEGEYNFFELKEIAHITGGVTKGRKLEGKETIELPYLRVANVQDGYLDLSLVKMIEVLKTDLLKYKLEYEDVLFTEGGDRDKLGRGTVWKNEVKNCIHQNHIFRARVNDKNELSPYYLTYFAQSPFGKGYFFKHGKHTTNLASINKTILSSLPVPLPNIRIQLEIVKQIESRLSVCDKVEESIVESLKKAQALRQSILKKAFEGKLLTEAEVAKCKAQSDYEPASVLLERINAEKMNQISKIKKKV